MSIEKKAITAAQTLPKESLETVFSDVAQFILENPDLDRRKPGLEFEHLKWIADGEVEKVEASFRSEFPMLVASSGPFAITEKKHFEYIAVTSLANCSLAAMYAGVPSQIVSAIRSYFMMQISAADDISSYYRLCFEFYTFITRYIRSFLQKSCGNTLVDRAMLLVSINLERSITVGEIASQLNTNADYLARLFQRFTGVGLKQYVLVQKLELAKSLLVNTDYSVSEIAVRLGFSSQSHFGKLFKDFFGNTPAQYRHAG